MPDATRPAAPSGLDAVHVLAWAVAALMAIAAIAGLAAPVYRDNELVAAGWRGNDLITLIAAVPLLVLAALGSARGGRAWRLILLGVLLYAFYGYAFYLFGGAFNALFLVYVAIVAASGYGLALGLGRLDVRAAAAGFPATAPARPVAAFMLLVGLLLGGFWVGISALFFLTGEPPAMVDATNHPTNVTGALDLAVVVPLALLAAHLLWRRRPWGYVLAIVWNVKGALYMVALSSAALSAYRVGAADDIAQIGLWAPIGGGCLAAALALLRGYGRAGG